MNKIFLILVLISSAVILAAHQTGFFRATLLNKIERYFSSNHRVKDCPYEGYTWQEVEEVVDKIVAQHVSGHHFDAIKNALETGKYGNSNTFLAYEALTAREREFLTMVFNTQHVKDEEQNEQKWIQQKILCGLLEAATAHALNILSEEAITIRDLCHQKFGLRWYPLVKARSYDSEFIDDQKLDQLSDDDSTLYLFWYLFFNEASA